MKPVSKWRSWNPCNPLTWLIILSLGLPLIKGQSNPPLTSNKELEPENQLNYGPIFFLPHAVTGSLVSDSKKVPKGYISPDGNDIGSKAENDDWREYLSSQNGLKILILLLLLLFLAVPILGLLYWCFCGRCKKSRRSRKEVRYCCGIFLAILAFLMLLFLIFAILAATQLNKSLKKTGHCQFQLSPSEPKSNSTSEHLRRQYVTIYNQMLQRLESEANATQSSTQGEALAGVIDQLSKVLQNMQQVKPLLGELRVELPRVRRLAIKFREVLSGVKRNLVVFLTSQCTQEECQDFYEDNQIEMLDKGCLQYEKLPDKEDLIKSIKKVLDSNFITYPRQAAQQLRQMSKAIKDKSNLLDTIKKDLNKGVKQLQNVTLEEVEEAEEKMPSIETKSTPAPAAALRRKLGRSWFGFTLGMIVFFLLVPILLLVGLLVALSSPNVASWLLCGVLVALFLLFSLVLVLVLFFLVHGALTYQAFCSGQHSLLVIDLPKKEGDVQRQRDLRLHDLKALSDNVKKDVQESLEKMKSAPLPSNLSSIHPQAEAAAQELLRGQLSTHKGSDFTRHMCREQVPEPKPGPLSKQISRLDILARRVGRPPILVNQITLLRAANRQLGPPLAVFVQRLLDKLQQLDALLSGGYRSFARYMSFLLARIKQGDEFLSNAKQVTANISESVESDLDKYFRMVDNSTKAAMESHVPPTRQESRPMREYNDLCERFAKPMNALWFWLLLFALMLLPAICCSHYLRCRLRGLRNHSQESLVSLGQENFVAAGMLPMELPQCYCYKYLPVAPETNVDQLEARNVYYEDQEGVRQRYRY